MILECFRYLKTVLTVVISNDCDMGVLGVPNLICCSLGFDCCVFAMSVN